VRWRNEIGTAKKQTGFVTYDDPGKFSPDNFGGSRNSTNLVSENFGWL